MSDPIFKISDVKSLKELAQALTLPLIAVAYFLQTGPQIGWKDLGYWSIPDGIPIANQLLFYFLFFTLKSIWICSGVTIVDSLFILLDSEYARIGLLVGNIVFLGTGILGLVASDSHPLLQHVNKFWFFACIVWGFACMSRIEKVAK